MYDHSCAGKRMTHYCVLLVARERKQYKNDIYLYNNLMNYYIILVLCIFNIVDVSFYNATKTYSPPSVFFLYIFLLLVSIFLAPWHCRSLPSPETGSAECCHALSLLYFIAPSFLLPVCRSGYSSVHPFVWSL